MEQIYKFHWIQEELKTCQKLQADLAAHIGINAQQLSASILGKRRFKTEELEALAGFFSISLCDVVDRSRVKPKENDVLGLTRAVSAVINQH